MLLLRRCGGASVHATAERVVTYVQRAVRWRNARNGLAILHPASLKRMRKAKTTLPPW